MIDNSIVIRGKTLKNRIVMPPMATSKTKDGIVKDDLIEYYNQRAEALGMIITEHAYVSEEGLAHVSQMGMLDVNLEAFTTLASQVHSHNTMIIAQISHAGGKAFVDKPIGPSDFDYSKKNPIVKAMDLKDIERVKEAFVKASLLAKQAHFDGVEVHIAHGYLLNQFYSPVTNCREDQYGGCVENRIRFACEVIQAIREACGEDFIICARLGSIDIGIDGNKIEDAIQASICIEKAGADLISISGGVTGYMKKDFQGLCYFEEEGKAIKEAISIPVLIVGGITTKMAGEQLLNNQNCDLIGVGRPLLKDPDYIKHF